jgi:ATP-dependent DNA helicase RecG
MIFPKQMGGQIGGQINNSIGGSIGGSIANPIHLTDRQQDIIGLIKQDPKISYRKMATKLDIADSAIKKHLNTLKAKGVLRRVGGTRGSWEILK